MGYASNGKSHWLFSCSAKKVRKGKAEVIVLDSLDSNTVSPSLQIQLSKLYGYSCNELVIKLPALQQKKTGLNCGLFAIAYMVEFSMGEFNKFDEQFFCAQHFEESKIREHLITCLEANRMTPFPKTDIQTHKPKIYNLSIKLHPQSCGLPDIFDNMIQCDRCSKWYVPQQLHEYIN